jgi:hypothetical protein
MESLKLVFNGYDHDELYDLNADLLETCNLIANDRCEPRYKKTVRELFGELWKFARRTDDVCIDPYVMVSLAAEGPGVAFE